jgi:hypothetical protein
MWGEADNLIVYEMNATGLAATQSFFLQPTFTDKPETLSNSAFVNIYAQNVPVYDGGENMGGPPWSQLGPTLEHVLFWDVTLPNQRLMIRIEPSTPPRAKNVSFIPQHGTPTAGLLPSLRKECCSRHVLRHLLKFGSELAFAALRTRKARRAKLMVKTIDAT